MLDPAIKAAANSVLAPVPTQILNLYTRYALLLNALDVARKEYDARQSVTLSTTKNIPEELRLSIEIDVQLDRGELVHVYGTKLPVAFCSSFLVELVSHFDAWMEDLYEQLIPLLQPAIQPRELERKLRAAWGDDGGMPALRRAFVVDLGLQTPSGKASTPAMVFDRYQEMRESRHAVVHTGGALTAKQVAKLQALAGSATPTATAAAGLVPGGVCVGAAVVVGAMELLALRRWAFDAIAYFDASFKAT